MDSTINMQLMQSTKISTCALFLCTAVLNGSLYLTAFSGPKLTITLDQTSGGIYDCVAFSDTGYAVGVGYLFGNPVVDNQQAETGSEVTFVCESSFPSPQESYQWIRKAPYAEPEVLHETGRSLTVNINFDDAGTVYTCIVATDVSGYHVSVSNGGLLTGETTGLLRYYFV